MPAESRPGTLVPAVERSRRVLGKGVHPAAIMRLHELWPDAVVRVGHGYDYALSHPDRPTMEVVRVTWVRIFERPGAPGGPVLGESRCREDDAYRRDYGIDLAFRRALRKVRERAA